MHKILVILAGGGLGAVSRYWLASGMQRVMPGSFPVGTFVVNLLGCLIFGALAKWLGESTTVRHEWQLAALVGYLGAFTTFSSFSWETWQLIQRGQWPLAALYVALTNLGCLLAIWIGYQGVGVLHAHA